MPVSDTGAEICAVLVASDPGGLYVMTLLERHRGQSHILSLPVAPFDPARGQSLEDRLRDWASIHTTAQINQIMQIKTGLNANTIRTSLLALVGDRNAFMPKGARWTLMDEIFPWENWQNGEPQSLSQTLRPALEEWSGERKEASERQRLDAVFASEPKAWHWALCQQRFACLYQAGLLPEALRDRTGAMVQMKPRHAHVYGQMMADDNRRTLSGALSLLRQQTAYAGALPALLLSPFTLGILQKTVEAIMGISLHTQNFRRDLMRTGLLTATGKRGRVGNSRPASLWQWTAAARLAGAQTHMPLPLRRW